MKIPFFNKQPEIIKDISLCTIVRDEKMNPAGGIERFIESHVPYVEEAVIVDTGSVDGTREILESLSSKHKNMKVYDRKFRGFADARNYSLKKSGCKWTLVLDADELLPHKKPWNYMKKLGKCLEESNGAKVFSVDSKHILPNGVEAYSPSWTERIFTKNGLIFNREVWENHNQGADEHMDITIYHFLPSYSGIIEKQKGFYNNIWENLKTGIPPSHTDGFEKWKQYNPQRRKYK